MCVILAAVPAARSWVCDKPVFQNQEIGSEGAFPRLRQSPSRIPFTSNKIQQAKRPVCCLGPLPRGGGPGSGRPWVASRGIGCIPSQLSAQSKLNEKLLPGGKHNNGISPQTSRLSRRVRSGQLIASSALSRGEKRSNQEIRAVAKSWGSSHEACSRRCADDSARLTHC